MKTTAVLAVLRSAGRCRPPSGARRAGAGAAPTVEERLDELDQKIRVLDRKTELDKEAAAEKAKTAGQATAGKDGFSSQIRRRQLPVEAARLRAIRRPLLPERRPEAAGPTPSRCAGCGRSSKAPSTRSSTSASCPTSAAARPCFRTPISRLASPRPSRCGPASSSRRWAWSACSRRPTSCSSSAPSPRTWCPTATSASRSRGDLAGGVATYAVGVFNGVPDGGSGTATPTTTRTLRPGSSSSLSSRGAARSRTWASAWPASTGEQEGTLTAPSLPAFRTPGQQTFFSYRTDGTAPEHGVCRRQPLPGFSPQGYFYTGPVRPARRIRDVQARTVRRGHGLRATWSTRPGRWRPPGCSPAASPPSGRVNPKTVFDRAADTWGAFELAARYQQARARRRHLPDLRQHRQLGAPRPRPGRSASTGISTRTCG